LEEIKLKIQEKNTRIFNKKYYKKKLTIMSIPLFYLFFVKKHPQTLFA
jgi:hypothetical protein